MADGDPLQPARTGVDPRSAGAASHGGPDAIPEELSGLLRVGAILLREWKLLMGLPFTAAVLAGVVVLLLPRTYTAAANFVPEVDHAGISMPGGIGGLASQFGVDVSGGPESPHFYAAILESRIILEAVLQDTFVTAAGVGHSLIDVLKIANEDPLKRRAKAVQKFRDMTRVSVDEETGIVGVSVEASTPLLAATLTNRLLAEVNAFNLETRQTRAGAQRRFVDERLQEARQDLLSAERELERFLDANRKFAQSASLQFEHDRLQRQLRVAEQVYLTLLQRYEEVRIEEIDDTPLISIIDPAVPPVRPSAPRRRLSVVLAAVVGLLLAAGVVLAKDRVARERDQQGLEYSDFVNSWARVKREFRNLLRRSGPKSPGQSR